MGRTLLWLLAIACLAATGCARNHYQIRMTPTDSGFERTLTCWTENTGDPPDPRALSTEELARIGQCYDSAPETGGEGRKAFHGTFSVETPKDVGGAGRLERIDTSLGTLWVYAERFRGNDDLESELTKRREAVDTLVDLTLGWLQKEFGEEAKFRQLEDFVDKTVRNDLKNLAVYLWVAEANSEDWETNGFLERLWLFARERDYLTLHDIAVLMRAGQTEDPAPVLDIVARLVARPMEIAPSSETLAILRDPQRLSASWSEHVGGSECYAQYFRMKQEESEAPGAVEPPEPREAVEHLLLEAFIHFDLASHDMLEVTLDAECKPISTNGTWNESEKTVTWSGSLGDRPALPFVCSATWAVPNAQEQTRRFGQVVLSGHELADYAMWYESLSDDEGEQWKGFLAACEPGEQLQETIRAFQFTDKTPAKEFLAARVKSLLIEDDEEEEE